MTINLKNLKKDSVICSGAYSLLGAVVGRAKVITDFEDLVADKITIEPDDIIFTAKTANYWNQYVKFYFKDFAMGGSCGDGVI